VGAAATGSDALDIYNAHSFEVADNASSAMRLALGLPIQR
jgi:hypothetical protein